MKTRHILPLLSALVLTFTARAAENNVIAYPTKDAPSFLIEVPADWQLTQAEEPGDYFHLDGPTGAVFSFRTIPGETKALEEAIEATVKDIGELFTDVELGDAQDWNPSGMSGFYATGTGKESDGTKVRIGVAWCSLKDGQIVEMWFVSDMNDQPGITAAEGIANSLVSP
jgi:hypothetical protein